MENKKIRKCINGHYFIGEKCPFCGENHIEEYEKRVADCIACGQLCPDGGYACNNPKPME